MRGSERVRVSEPADTVRIVDKRDRKERRERGTVGVVKE